MGSSQDIAASLKGRACTDVARWPETDTWKFEFGQGLSIQVACLWRIVQGSKIVLGRQDDGQRFGRPQPIDGPTAARALLLGRTVLAATFAEAQADVAIEFDDSTRLDIYNDSSGYEGWQCFAADITLIGMGGGGIVVYPK